MPMSRKRIGIAFLLFSAISSVAAPRRTPTTDAVYKTNATLEAKHATSDFAPDANLDKKIWKHAKWAEFDHSMDGKTPFPAEKTRVTAVWTEKYVYFAFWCKYEHLNVFEGEDAEKERWELWN